MANTFSVSRAQLIYALCLPLAVLMGYFLAEPLDLGTVVVVITVLGLFTFPVLMRYHHPLLVVCWNAVVTPLFLPGQPYLWSLMALTSMFFAILNRSIDADRRFLHAPPLTKSLLFLMAVVIATMIATGGFGFHAFGGERYGGKGYFYVLMAIVGYFAFASERIPVEKAGLYIGLFLLANLTSVVSHLAYMAGPRLYWLFYFFPLNAAVDQAKGEATLGASMVRYEGLPVAAAGIYGLLLARYGFRGIFDLARPWRLALLILAIFGCMQSGFRSNLILLLLTVTAVFWMEGLWRSRYMPIATCAALVAGTLFLANVDKLPIAAQRSLTFLPINVDPIARESAAATYEWRLEMWKRLLPEIPRYLIKGKGYAVDATDLYLAQNAQMLGLDAGTSVSTVAGDYHNGPLSVIIPFGIFGVLAFAWFIIASFRTLHHNYRYGDPALERINRYLLAAFFAKLVFFLTVFGSLYVDLAVFTGIVGMSVSLNGGIASPYKAGEELYSTDELKTAELRTAEL